MLSEQNNANAQSVSYIIFSITLIDFKLTTLCEEMSWVYLDNTIISTFLHDFYGFSLLYRLQSSESHLALAFL